MNAHHSAAHEAVKAAACPKQSASHVGLPTTKQTMLMAVAHVQLSLESLVHTRLNDQDWDECDLDVDYSVQQALNCIESLREELPVKRGDFEQQWFTAASIINLSARCFSRKECPYYRALTNLQKQFDVLISVVEFVEGETEHG